MKGAITFGNAWKGKRSYFLECYADPIGPSLQCGWQLTTNEVSGFIAHTDYGRRMDQKQTKIHNDPNTARQLNGILQSFHQMVFLPTLQDLINACGAQQQQSSGFLGA
jgi:hypothetical protein